MTYSQTSPNKFGGFSRKSLNLNLWKMLTLTTNALYIQVKHGESPKVSVGKHDFPKGLMWDSLNENPSKINFTSSKLVM